MNIRQKTQQGFTLIELVIVIVILGVLAAVALPKFVDLKSDAQLAALDGVAGALSSGSVTNYAARIAGKSTAVTINQANVCDNTIISGLTVGGIPAGYTVSSGGGPGDCSGTNESVTCDLMNGSNIKQFTVVCAR